MLKISDVVFVVGGLGLALAACSSPPPPPPVTSAPPPSAPSVSDLVGARGSSGEMELQKRGYSPAVTKGLTTFWWHPAGTCVRVVTAQGRYKTVEPASGVQCGKTTASAAPAAPAAPAASGQTISRATPTKDEQACLQAITAKTQNADVVLLTGTETSEANNAVYVGVGPQHAKWRCLVKNGQVSEMTSMTDEGRL